MYEKLILKETLNKPFHTLKGTYISVWQNKNRSKSYYIPLFHRNPGLELFFLNVEQKHITISMNLL